MAAAVLLLASVSMAPAAAESVHIFTMGPENTFIPVEDGTITPDEKPRFIGTTTADSLLLHVDDVQVGETGSVKKDGSWERKYGGPALSQGTHVLTAETPRRHHTGAVHLRGVYKFRDQDHQHGIRARDGNRRERHMGAIGRGHRNPDGTPTFRGTSGNTDNLTFNIDGVQMGTSTKTQWDGTYQRNWKEAPLANGTYTLTVTARQAEEPLAVVSFVIYSEQSDGIPDEEVPEPDPAGDHPEDQDTTSDVLSRMVKELEDKVTTLGDVIADRDAEIATLKEQISRTIHDKDSEIERLRAENDLLRQNSLNSTDDIRELERENAGLRDEMIILNHRLQMGNMDHGRERWNNTIPDGESWIMATKVIYYNGAPRNNPNSEIETQITIDKTWITLDKTSYKTYEVVRGIAKVIPPDDPYWIINVNGTDVQPLSVGYRAEKVSSNSVGPGHGCKEWRDVSDYLEWVPDRFVGVFNPQRCIDENGMFNLGVATLGYAGEYKIRFTMGPNYGEYDKDRNYVPMYDEYGDNVDWHIDMYSEPFRVTPHEDLRGDPP